MEVKPAMWFQSEQTFACGTWKIPDKTAHVQSIRYPQTHLMKQGYLTNPPGQVPWHLSLLHPELSHGLRFAVLLIHQAVHPPRCFFACHPKLGCPFLVLTRWTLPGKQPVNNTDLLSASTWAASQHIDTSNKTKAWAVSQHINTSNKTKAWAVSQHTDTRNKTKAWAVSQHTDTSNKTKAWAVSQHINTSSKTNTSNKT